MQLYTGKDLARGAGIFDYIMMTQVERVRVTRMRSRDAIGIIAAAFKSGLRSSQVEAFIDEYFEREDQELLVHVLKMYEGDDSRIHLWNRAASKDGRLCNNLRYDSRPEWCLSYVDEGKLAI